MTCMCVCMPAGARKCWYISATVCYYIFMHFYLFICKCGLERSTPVCTSIILHVLRKLNLLASYANDLLLFFIFVVLISVLTGMRTITFSVLKFIYLCFVLYIHECMY